MSAFLALLRREYLEHRVAFFYVPLILVGLFAAFVISVVAAGHVTVLISAVPGSPLRIYAAGYFAIALLWWLYLAMLLFFYFADAFHADTRNNAMLFWKSLPQSDFKILLSKLSTGLSIFPGLVFVAALLCGLVLLLATLVLPFIVPAFAALGAADLANEWLQLSLAFFCYMVIALLWYVPFFAWVGALSTVFGRWSVPLALLIPVGVSLFEGVVDFQRAPGGSYVLSFLKARTDLRYDSAPLLAGLLSPTSFDGPYVMQRLIAYIDWPQTIGGIVFAIVVIWLASLYRRRVIKG
jgi:ABC-2 type transport system permease protein